MYQLQLPCECLFCDDYDGLPLKTHLHYKIENASYVKFSCLECEPKHAAEKQQVSNEKLILYFQYRVVFIIHSYSCILGKRVTKI